MNNDSNVIGEMPSRLLEWLGGCEIENSAAIWRLKGWTVGSK